MSEAIIKTVKKYGNSGGVYVPSSWVGGKVKVELIDEPFNPRTALNKIELEHIVGAILYGSYARKEAAEGSDIDMLLVSDDKKISIPAELGKKYDIQVKTAEEAKNAMMHDPIFYKLIMDESVALINHQFLDSLKKELLNSNSIRKRIGLAESSMDIIKKLFEAGGTTEIIYPLIMRLKEILILECLLNKKKYSTAYMKNDILRCITAAEFSSIMSIYRAARSGKKSGKPIAKETIEKLISFLEAKIKNVKAKN
ncbi:MAG TPA: DUF2080 family transposase-associated protein [archaeon]|nr:DUF2080 family transposase-associated protein [archaeon]